MSRFSIFRWGKSKGAKDRSNSDESPFVADHVGQTKVPQSRRDDDPYLPEKKRARRRLVGSVALVLAAIIVLPMIFESKPRQASTDLQIDIPSRDEPLKTASPSQTIDVPEEVPESDAQGDTQEQEAAPIETPAPKVSPAAGSDKTSGVKDDAASMLPEKLATAPASAPVKETGSRTDKKPDGVDKSAEKPVQGKPVADNDADPIGKMIADKNGPSPKPEKQLIQVAAFTSPQKVSELQERLSRAGIRSYTQKVKSSGGEEWIRVRVGPLSSQAEVDRTCSRLRSMGLSCTLVSN